MKHIIIPLFLLIISLVSCEIETSHNGKLDGNWQLQHIDTLATNGTCDMTHSYIYWAVENDLLQVRDIDNQNLKILFRFERQDGNLTLHSPHFVVTKDELIPLESDSLLQPLGIPDLRSTFLIESLTHSRMTLKGAQLRLHFRKY